jgi:GR25 family glycosyltransferase involved in LPS biosynthesis
MNDHAFVISLARATTRAENARRLLERLPMTGELLPAVDGRAMSEDEIRAVYVRELHSPRYPFELRANEVGCFLSHRKAWQAIVDRGLEAGLILEDDVTIDESRIDAAIACLRSHQSRFPYVQLPVRPIPTSAETIFQSDGHAVRMSRVTLLRCSGQWVTRHGAEQLLRATKTFDRPVDTTLQMHWLTGIRCVTLDPTCIIDSGNDLGGSTIGDNKPSRLRFAKLRREVDRTLYRTKIANLSSRHAQNAWSRAA